MGGDGYMDNDGTGIPDIFTIEFSYNITDMLSNITICDRDIDIHFMSHRHNWAVVFIANNIMSIISYTVSDIKFVNLCTITYLIILLLFI